jgi:hypothetical protein
MSVRVNSPCPYCGRGNVFIAVGGNGLEGITCPACGVKFRYMYLQIKGEKESLLWTSKEFGTPEMDIDRTIEEANRRIKEKEDET